MSDHHVDQHLDHMDELIDEDLRDQAERHEERRIIESIPRRWTEDTQREMFIEEAAMRRVNRHE